MAIFGPLSTVHCQLDGAARFNPAFAYLADLLNSKSLAHRRINQIAIGASERIELGAGAFAIEQVYCTKPRAEGFFESHRKYIDIQMVVEGEELMEVEDISRLVVAEAYNEERDLIKYADTTAGSLLKLRTGDTALFFPLDGHMPGLQVAGPALVRKTVVKVPVNVGGGVPSPR